MFEGGFRRDGFEQVLRRVGGATGVFWEADIWQPNTVAGGDETKRRGTGRRYKKSNRIKRAKQRNSIT
jgi:hypothetical protein